MMTPLERREFDELKRQSEAMGRELARVTEILNKERGGSKEGPSTRVDARGGPLVGGSPAGAIGIASGPDTAGFRPLRSLVGDWFPNGEAISLPHTVVTPPGDLPPITGDGFPAGEEGDMLFYGEAGWEVLPAPTVVSADPVLRHDGTAPYWDEPEGCE